MTYIENIFLCMVSPLLVAALCMGRRQLRFFLFCIAGMGVCLLSAYINTFLATVCRADALAATAEIAPVVEEMMKLLPLVFYLLVFEPEGDKIKAAAITIALAFATFENVCYLIQNGADRFSFIFFRGFGTGAMHVLCGLIVGDEQIIDGVEGDGRAQQPAGACDLQPRPLPCVCKPAAHDQTAEDVHGSRAEAPEEDEGEAVSAVLDEIAHIFKGGKGEGNRDGGSLDFIPLRLKHQQIEHQRQQLHHLLHHRRDLRRGGKGICLTHRRKEGIDIG